MSYWSKVIVIKKIIGVEAKERRYTIVKGGLNAANLRNT